MRLATTALIAALTILPPMQAAAAFVDHQAIRACHARAQFLLTGNNGKMVISDRAFIAARAAKGWRVSGDVSVSETNTNGAYHVECTVNEDGVVIDLTQHAALDTIKR